MTITAIFNELDNTVNNFFAEADKTVEKLKETEAERKAIKEAKED